MNKRFATSFATLAALALLALPARAETVEGGFSRSLTVGAGEVELHVNTSAGNITVRAGSEGAVQVQARIRARSSWSSGLEAAEKVRRIESNPPIEQLGNVIRIGRLDDRELRQNVSISYELVVPARTRFYGDTGSGDQRIEGIQAGLRANTGSGNLVVLNTSGDARLQTGSGDIELSGIKGRVYAATGSGSIRGTQVAGAFVGSTGSGDIRVQQAASGEVQVETGSGDVQVSGVNGPLSVSTGSGDVRVSGRQDGEWRLSAGSGSVTVELPSGSGFELDARTSSGRIDLDHPVTVQGSLRRNEVRGRVGGGGSLLRVRTGSGDISIH